ncbi:DUF6777 domain-containing protein [Streptomyces sp. NPDC007369]|uniref:DUF6777 domain-containing protein n=1 Tax=Streptomyces sp. NPDC007369 TaxID=3154589 RepID=UPI00340CF515
MIDTPSGTGAGARGPGAGGTGGGGGRGGSGGGSWGGGPPAPPPGRGEPPTPWWRSIPRLVTAAVAVAAVVALAVVLTRPSGPPRADGELFLESAAAEGQDPYTASTVTEPAPPAATTQPPRPPATLTGPITARAVTGSSPTLYGGTRNVASCDIEKQVRLLSAEPDKNRAFAGALGIESSTVPAYLRSLTPVTLRNDTRVTNHGYRDGSQRPYQAVLQAGTAVLVDSRGVPRVRCACGNPLGEPVPLRAGSTRQGTPWAAYQPQNVVVVLPTIKIINEITIYDQRTGRWYERGPGAPKGPEDRDRPVPPPPLPPPPPVTPDSSPSPAPTGRPTGRPTGTGTPTGTGKPTETGKPTGTGKPTETGKPTGTGTPEGTPTPKATPTPKDTGSPADTASPPAPPPVPTPAPTGPAPAATPPLPPPAATPPPPPPVVPTPPPPLVSPPPPVVPSVPPVVPSPASPP